MKPQAREELWGASSRVEPAPKHHAAAAPANGNAGNGNGAGHGKNNPFDTELDDEISLEIEEIGGFY
jgi:hypothetical protein